ncbi:MAG: CPBP family intramembrane glutamic endopeptidase [Terriglobales bacterium]
MQDAENQSFNEPRAPSNLGLGSANSRPTRLGPFNARWRAGIRFFAFLILVRLVLIPLAFWAVQPFFPGDKAHWGDFAEAIVLACVLIGTWIMAKVERRSVLSYGLRDRRAFRHLATGALTGFLSLTLMLLGLFATHHLEFRLSRSSIAVLVTTAFTNVLAFLIVAVFEETAFRGYALYTLRQAIGFWPAAIAMSLFFAFAHRGNPGEANAGLMAVFVFGLILAFSVWRTGTLLWAIGFHFMWDYSESFLYGVPDSGFVSPEHLLSAKFLGPAWITGGSVGPEGSWFIFLILATVALVIHFRYPQRRFRVLQSEGQGLG